MRFKIILVLFNLIFLISALWVLSYLQQNKQAEIGNIENNSLESFNIAFNSIVDTYKITAETNYQDLMRNNALIETLQKFKNSTDEKQKAILRGKLFRLLHKKYKQLQTLGVRQFHIHTYDGKSLLRFHEPSKNGDSLIEFRDSIRYVKENKKPFVSFEGGKIYPGFRYLFPIISDNHEYLGSIEFSIPFEMIENRLQQTLPTLAYQIHLDRKISYDLVFDNFKAYFTPSKLLLQHYTENPKISQLENKLKHDTLLQTLTNEFHKKIPPRLLGSSRNFSLYLMIGDDGYMANFISINKGQKHLAYIVSFRNFVQLININNKYDTLYLILFIVVSIVFLLSFILVVQIKKIIIKNKHIQRLIDTQNNIVILSDGAQIHFANTKFFNFFGFSDLASFQQEHQCICKFFIRDDNFFHLGKVGDYRDWIEALKELPDSKRVVSMLEKDRSLHAFSINISSFDDTDDIVTFTDISKTIQEQIQLHDKIIHDPLTHAFNREYFDQNYPILLQDYTSQTSHFALAMIDLDHFKNVNDTYGHDVGDNVLIELVQTIKKHSREDDILVRWGGEEFVFILKVANKKTLYKILDYLRSQVALHTFPNISNLTCSIGATLYKEHETIEKTLKRADEGVYKAKTSGRNRVVIL